jgi:hypothetical protein
MTGVHKGSIGLGNTAELATSSCLWTARNDREVGGERIFYAGESRKHGNTFRNQ